MDERVAQFTRDAGTGNWSLNYIHADRQNSVTALSDQWGTLLWPRRAYGAYGETSSAQMAGHPFGYTGRRWVDELGLYYYRARWYDPELGTFLQPDPIGSLDYVNLYAYVGLEPGNATDPTGLYTCTSKDEGACDVVDSFYAKAEEVLASLPENSRAANQLASALNALGKPGEKNGVEIVASKGGSLGSARVEGGGVKIGVDVGAIESSSKRWEPSNPHMSGRELFLNRGAGVLGHEGTHARDFRNWFGWRRGPETRAEVEMTERNAYTTNQIMEQAARINLGMNPPNATAADLENAIQEGVGRSLNLVCKRSPILC